ncbi:MAG: DUF1318 domain-containing protein [Proteobacteria bacterium]|jgi:uncharacterized protein YdbL (DUF1318 family)|nr:YdbL family protein [Alphaproteobacteria bacterium]NCC02674.1 DUF1318 domain-containing protein [Pseudomonadota bacterium]
MKLKQLTMLALLGIMIAAPAYALDLKQARNSGVVGEKLDGYAEVLKPSPDVKVLVDDVNAKRTVEYQRISKENGQPIDVVAKLAAQEIISKLPAGSLYQAVDGSWKKK